MGITYIDGVARGPTGKEANVSFLVYCGANYTLLPIEVWQERDLKATREQDSVLADGTRITRRISRCYLLLPQGETPTPVILGEVGDEPLLGVVNFEELGLVLNPFNRTLQPMHQPMQTMLA